MEYQLVICVRNEGYAVSLERRKLYLQLPDSKAESLQLIRVIDESGEDYLYPEDYFVSVKLPAAIARAVIDAA